MLISHLGWWLIVALTLFAYFVFRFGIVSRGNSKHYIEFVGGILLFTSFVLMFAIYGWKSGFLLIVIFWIVITPLVEWPIHKIREKIEEPYNNARSYFEQKYQSKFNQR